MEMQLNIKQDKYVPTLIIEVATYFNSDYNRKYANIHHMVACSRSAVQLLMNLDLENARVLI